MSGVHAPSADALSVNPSSGPVPLARHWQRHSKAESFWRWAVWLIIVAAIVQSLRTVEVIPEFLADAPEQMADMVKRMWPVDWNHYPKSVHAGLVRHRRIPVVGYRVSRFHHSAGHHRAVRIGDSSRDACVGRLSERRRDTQQGD